MPDTPPTPLALFLAEHDVPCPNPKCGFNLRGLKDATCPECKEPLSLAVRRPEALWYMRKWVVAAAALTALVAAFQAADRVRAIHAEFGQPWIGWTDWLVLSVHGGAFLGLAIVLPRYVLHLRRKNTRAVPFLLRGFLVASMSMLGLDAFWYLWALWDRVWGIERGF